jgi:hypothetical protein
MAYWPVVGIYFFAQLLRGDVAALQQILEYHVLVGVLVANNFITSTTGQFVTVEGRNVTFDNNTTMFNNAGVIPPANILANNGVLFTIDAVLDFPDAARQGMTSVPTSAPAPAPNMTDEPTVTIMVILQERQDLSRLVTAVTRGQLDEVLGRPIPRLLHDLDLMVDAAARKSPYYAIIT